VKDKYFNTIDNVVDELTRETSSQDTLSERIKYALARKGIRKIDLAKKMGVKHQIIQYLCEREVKSSKFTPLIAEALEVNLEWLSTGKGAFEKAFAGGQSSTYDIPLLDEEGIKYLLETKQLPDNKYIKRFVPSFTKIEDPQACFAFLITDTAMLPVFPKGSLVFIDRNRKLKDDLYGLFYIENKDIVLRKIKKEEDRVTLIALNELLYKNIIFSENDIFIGIVTEIRWKDHEENY
jgi:phage repressor protein C with HTH and peptisase S24 domain